MARMGKGPHFSRYQGAFRENNLEKAEAPGGVNSLENGGEKKERRIHL